MIFWAKKERKEKDLRAGNRTENREQGTENREQNV